MALAEFVAAKLRELGVSVEMQEVLPGRANVIGTLPGLERTRRLLFEAHLDTVQTTGMTVNPFDGEVRKGRLYGRGACDTKASLAAMLLAMRVLRESPPACDVVLAAVVDEEVTFRGAQALASSGSHADAAIVGEPTDLRIGVAHKGLVRFHVEVLGRAAHSATPSDGLNAIDGMVQVLDRLRNEAVRLAGHVHPLTGSATVCVTEIHGGSGINTIPARCTAHIDRRVNPGESSQEVWRELRRKIEQAVTTFPGAVVVHEPYLLADPLETAPDVPVVRALADAVTEVAGNAELVGLPCATDASELAKIGIPCVVFGPGSLSDAHTAAESVSLTDVAQAAQILVLVAQRF